MIGLDANVLARYYVRVRPRGELDPTDQAVVDALFAAEKPGHELLAAAKIGGIHANDAYPAGFIRDNLAIQTNVIHSAVEARRLQAGLLGSLRAMAPVAVQQGTMQNGPARGDLRRQPRVSGASRRNRIPCRRK